MHHSINEGFCQTPLPMCVVHWSFNNFCFIGLDCWDWLISILVMKIEYYSDANIRGKRNEVSTLLIISSAL